MAELHIEILITAPIPEGKKTLGYKAIVETEAAADAIVKKLHDIGLTGATQTRDIRKRKSVAAPAAVAQVPDRATVPDEG